MPLDDRKEEGPSKVLTLLELEIDMLKLEARLPQEKLKEMRGILKRWRGMKSCRRRDLESNHACRAVRPGRAFKRRLKDLMTTVVRDDWRVRLNWEVRADIEWWYQFGLEWNGTALMRVLATEEEPQEVCCETHPGGGVVGQPGKTSGFR